MFIDDRPKRMTMMNNEHAERIMEENRHKERELGEKGRQEFYTRADPGREMLIQTGF